MSRKTLPGLRSCCIALLAAALATVGSSGQDAPPKEPANAGTATSVRPAQLVKTGLYLFASDTGNSLVRLTASGMILIDGQVPGDCDALHKQVMRASRILDQSIRIVINTDHHPQRTGCNAKLLAKGAQILMQENAAKNLAVYQPPSGPIAAPAKTYDRLLNLKVGGVEVQVMHFGTAHTNGDTVVYFPHMRAVAVGDLYAATPDPSFSEGGSLVGWGPVLAEVLKLDFETVVPGTGPTVAKADLAAFKDKIDTLVSRAAALVKQGVPKDRLMAELKTDDLGWSFTFTGDRLDRFFDELSSTR